MRALFTVDRKDYPPDGDASLRVSVRAVILRGNRLIMLKSAADGHLEFPGGGIEEGETPETALIREIREETGLTVIPDSIREYGSVRRIEKGKRESVFIQDNAIYLCETEPTAAQQSLSEKERAEGMEVIETDPAAALRVNRELMRTNGESGHLLRDCGVLEQLIAHGIVRTGFPTKRPSMILFDYGHTILWEPDWDSMRGNRELLKYAVKNPNRCTVEDVQREIDSVFREIDGIREGMGVDISCVVGDRLAFGHLGIELSLTPLEHEIVFWNAASKGAVVPHADELIDHLNETGIRTGVISNNGWSGEALKNRIDRLLPRNRFEFVLSSADYMIRKPDRRLFEIALIKAGLAPEDVWFCGDRMEADVLGAHGAGIFPVHYSGFDDPADSLTDPGFPYLSVRDWRELIGFLKTLSDRVGDNDRPSPRSHP
jgi:putative hydrolase of the HAD superfamily